LHFFFGISVFTNVSVHSPEYIGNQKSTDYDTNSNIEDDPFVLTEEETLFRWSLFIDFFRVENNSINSIIVDRVSEGIRYRL